MLAPADDASNKSNDDTEIDTQIVEVCNPKYINNKPNTLTKIKQAQYHVNVDSEGSTTGDSESTENGGDIHVYSQRRNAYMVDQSPPEANNYFAESLNRHFSREDSFTNTDVNCFEEYSSTPV